MKTSKLILIMVAFLFMFSFTLPAAGSPSASIIVNNADTVRQDAFNINQNLLDKFSEVATRIIVQFADNLNQMSMTYPIELFDDNTPPNISNVSAKGMGIITWTTDEYATSTVIYGTQLVEDSGEISDPLYTKQHQVSLPGLTPGTTYYYQVRSTDRSDNTSTSKQHSFTAQVSLSIYIPIVSR